jgi:hypothetical protein
MEPSARILPRCSTVTLCAMRETNSMSCSMTMMERPLADALDQLGGLLALGGLMPATGSSSISSPAPA